MLQRIEVDQKDLARLVAALRAEEDGKELGRDLARELRKVAEPARDAARAAIKSMPSRSMVEPHLRFAVAEHTTVSVRLSGRSPGVAIRASKSGMPRGFRSAAQRLNRKQGWRHPVFGGPWVRQVGRPGWFDDTIEPFKPAAQRAAADAMDAVARRIDQRTKG